MGKEVQKELFLVQDDKLIRNFLILSLVSFGLGYSLSSYKAAQEQQRKEKAELQEKVDRCTGWATRFLTLKNGDNYTEELKGKYVDICLENYSMMIEYYKSIGRKL